MRNLRERGALRRAETQKWPNRLKPFSSDEPNISRFDLSSPHDLALRCGADTTQPTALCRADYCPQGDGLDRPRWDPIILGSPGPSKLAAGAFLRGDHACLERAGRRQSADRWLTDVEAPRYVGLRFAVSKPLHRFLSLMRRQGCRATEFHATSFRALPAIFRASPDQLTLEFSQAAKHS